MVSLKIRDLDLVGGRAWVQKKSRELDARYYVYLDDAVVEAVRDYFAYERRDNLAGGDYVFTNGRGHGQPLHRGSVWQILRKYGETVGASGPVNPHSFRHAFAILRLQAGEDLVSLKDLMGHSDIKVTADSYGRYQESQLREAHRAFSPLNQLVGK
jgi:integrase/recombinase XerD